MASYVAFLRGINVGGHGALSMKRLAEICTDMGLKEVRTYINSGNVLFKSSLVEKQLKNKVEKTLLEKEGKSIGVAVRTLSELISIVSQNPFPKAHPSRVGVLFLNDVPPKNFIQEVRNVGSEEIKLGKREVYIYYPEGMGQSKLKLPAVGKAGTVRNINTIQKLSEFRT